MSSLKKQIGSRIRELRIKHNLKQSELAEKAGIAAKHQSCIETGRNFPSAELFEKYAFVFGIEPAEVLMINSAPLQKPRREIIDNISRNINTASDYELSVIDKLVSCFVRN